MLGTIGAALIGAAGSIFSARQANKTQEGIAAQANATNTAFFHAANRFNAREARAAWTRKRAADAQDYVRSQKLDNSKVQRHVRDLRIAGINPVLGVNTPSPLGLSTNSAVSSSAGHFAGAQQYQVREELGAGINTGMEMYKTQLFGKQTEANIDKTRSEIKTLAKGRQLTDQQIDKLAHDMALIEETIPRIQAQTKGQQQFNELKEVFITLLRTWEINEHAGNSLDMLDTARDYLGKFGSTIGMHLFDAFDAAVDAVRNW